MSQVNRNVVSSIRTFVYKLLQELPNHLRLRISKNKTILGKFQNWRGHRLVPSLPSINKCLPPVVKNYTNTDVELSYSCPIWLNYFTFEIYFAEDCRYEIVDI